MKKMILALFCAIAVCASAFDLDVEPVSFAPADGDYPAVPYVQAGNDGWKTSEPLFSLEEENLSAEGRLAVSDEFLRILLIVKDPQHSPNGNGKTIWKGDSIQVGIDALGDGSEVAPPPDVGDLPLKIAEMVARDKGRHVKWIMDALGKLEARKEAILAGTADLLVFDSNDGSYTIAGGKDGATVWCAGHGLPGHTGAKKNVIADITRDEVAKTTTYDLAFPWSEFGAPALFSDALKISIQINNSTEGVKGQQRIGWGSGLGAGFMPWKFNRLAVALPNKECAEVLVQKKRVYSDDDAAELLFALSSGRDYELAILVDGEKKTETITPSADGVRSFCRVKIAAGEMAAGSKVLEFQCSVAGQNLVNEDFVLRSESMDNWWAFNPENDNGESVIGMEDWLDAPAGQFGRVQMKGGDFVYEKTGKPVKFWGVNLSSGDNMPPKDDADFMAAHYAKYGINMVRLHKFSGSLTEPNDCTKPKASELDRLDYLFAQLKERGMYMIIDPIFGLTVGEGNRDQLLDYDEVKNILRGKTYGLVNTAPDIQDLYIKLAVNLLDHKNPYTGLRYADDPALLYLEMHNEDDIYWSSTAGAVRRTPSYKKQFCGYFCDWLIEKYGNEETLLTAWGENSLTAYPQFTPGRESLEEGTIFPIANCWFFNLDNIAQQEEEVGTRQRLLDTAQFLYEFQNQFYGRFEKALRDIGYDGVLVSSCWQAGSDLGHYYNMHSDYLIGPIDRHNYHGGMGAGVWAIRGGPFKTTSLLEQPGSGLFGSGVQQVLDRPFLLTEWLPVIPHQWRADAEPIIAYYGFGLQGWDGSAEFGSQEGGLTTGLTRPGGQNIFNMETPDGIGLYPALARSIYRGDVKESDPVSIRNVCIPELQNGIIGFDEEVKQDGDVKTFHGDLPSEALAFGRVGIEFTAEQEVSSFPDLGKQLEEKKIVSVTGELEWDYKDKEQAFFTVNTPATKAVVGFPPTEKLQLGDVSIEVDNRYATILLTSLEQDKNIADAKRLLLTCVARVRHTGMEYNLSENWLNSVGTPPLLMEPVFATLTVPGAKRVILLDHDGRTTSKKLHVSPEGRFEVNGAQDQTMYYEIVK